MNKTIKEKIADLREAMKREKIDAYIVAGVDPHASEYLPTAWKQREWISGFSGSAGTVVVTMNKVCLWTDSRYFIQAEHELEGSEIELFKLNTPNVLDYPEWLATQLQVGECLGIDSFCTSVTLYNKLESLLNPLNIEIVEKNEIIGDVWLDRPTMSDAPIYLVQEEYIDNSTNDKIELIRESLGDNDYYLISALDEIAWLYNIRCNDISYNPVAICYAIISKRSAYLFIKRFKVSQNIAIQLEVQGITLHDYHHLSLFIDELSNNCSFYLDSNTINYAIYNKLKFKFNVVHINSLVALPKAIKTFKEIDGIKKACIKDGIALTKFFMWLEENTMTSQTEISVAKKLIELKSLDNDYISESFGVISAYGANAALPHYSATKQKHDVIKAEGFYLVDAGSQYAHGTTDITRTIALCSSDELSEQARIDYTLVLKGHIALASISFPKGCNGCNLDILARQAMWKKLINYGHGTGHGIGFFLNVHEGPQVIRQDLKSQAILAGMLTSNEPGIYREGSHGIRLENMILCKEQTVNNFGEWLNFDTVSLCYFDTKPIVVELLNDDEKEWLNNYHRLVFEKLSPLLSNEERLWLKNKTRPL